MQDIKQGDFLELIKDISNESVDLIIIDPPYRTTQRGNGGNTGGMFQKEIVNKGKVFKHNDINIEQWLPELYRILKQNSHCYIMTNNKNITNFLNVIDKSKFKFIKNLIWVKDNKIMGQTYMSQYEYIIMLRKGHHKKINYCGASDIIFAKNKKMKDKNNKTIHDTEKPVDLLETLIINSSNQNDVVFDGFMGIGSTGVACINTNRRFIGFELDEKYFNVAKKRLQQLA